MALGLTKPQTEMNKDKGEAIPLQPYGAQRVLEG
jgi:hypothetical protein